MNVSTVAHHGYAKLCIIKGTCCFAIKGIRPKGAFARLLQDRSTAMPQAARSQAMRSQAARVIVAVVVAFTAGSSGVLYSTRGFLGAAVQPVILGLLTAGCLRDVSLDFCSRES
jgi:hypothetical protein